MNILVTNISLILSVLLDTLQLATGATGLWSSGSDSSCFMGVLFVHWATIRVKNQLPYRLPSLRVVRAQRITPDFIVEYFIEPYQQYTQTTLH